MRAHYCELPSGTLICKLRSVSEAPAETILTLLLAFSGKRDIAWCGVTRGLGLWARNPVLMDRFGFLQT